MQERIGGENDGVAGGQLLKLRPFVARDSMMHQHRKIGEARRLLLPVAYDRCGTDQQYGARSVFVPVIALDQRQRLNRFAKPHVVGETGAETPALQKMQPGIAANLIRTQRPAQPLGLRQLLERRLPLQLRQQIRNPPGRADSADFERARRGIRPQCHLNDFARSGCVRGMLLQKLDSGADPVAIGFDPLPAEFDQRRFHTGKRGELAQGKFLVAERYFPLKIDDGFERNAAAAFEHGALHASLGCQTRLRAATCPPPRQHDAEPALLQGGGFHCQEIVRSGSVELVAGGRTLSETGFDARADCRGLSQ